MKIVEGHRKVLQIRKNLDAQGVGDPGEKVLFLCGSSVGGGGRVGCVWCFSQPQTKLSAPQPAA